MDVDEIEDKIRQYCQLWKLYAENSELKRKSKLSREKTVTACKVYGLYISDILQQVDEVMKLFAMEKELKIIKNRGYFPVPEITPQGTKIKSTKDIDKVLEAVDKEVVEMITAVRESELNYKKEKEEARNKEQQVRLARQTNRSDFNFLIMNSSTPIRNTNTAQQTRTNQHQHTDTVVHFNPNTVSHFYPMTDPTSHSDRYEPPANDSIIPRSKLCTRRSVCNQHSWCNRSQ